MPAFAQVLQGVRAWHDDKPDEMRAQNGALARFLAERAQAGAHEGILDDTPIRSALARIAAGFDETNGGHRGAPKFPHASEIELLLGSADLRPMARLTLSRMRDRGLADHLGGGFFRYCVDARWEIPHFEKMLYDNALLLPLYARASALFDESAFAATTNTCAEWLARELQAPDGGLWSSYDADSEGEEGRYYVWQADDVRAALDAGEYALIEPYYGLDRAPNFEDHAWHLVVQHPLADVAMDLGIDIDEARRRLACANAKLLALRGQRIRPGLDDKILTAWNALAISGAARAARWMKTAPLFAEAERALDVLHDKLWIDGRLYASLAAGRTRFPAYLDDHAFLLDALLALLQVRWRERDLDWAIALADTLLERFEDRDGGGFFFTAHDAEALPQRPKPFIDESLPAGNGIAARALLALGHLLGETRYLDAAERTLRAAWSSLAELPHACCATLLALGDHLEPRTVVVLRADDDELDRWRSALAHIDATGTDRWRIPSAATLPGVLARQAHVAGGVAYVCTGSACLPRITDPAILIQQLAVS
jgi:uncharacterized protein YyaL (SSP411 family)